MENLFISAILGIPFLLCLFAAHVMVKNRIGFAKNKVIGKDSDETIEKMKELARAAMTGKILSSSTDIAVEISQKDNEIYKVKVDNGKTRLVLLKNEKNASVMHLGFSEIGATIIVAIELWAYIFVIMGIIYLIVYAITSTGSAV